MTGNSKDKTTTHPHRSTAWWIKTAAIWLVLLGGGALVYKMFEPSDIKMLTLASAGMVKTDTLPDGSVITLNKNSSVIYPEKFAGNTRQIRLDRGEAFFDIAHDKAKPFLIDVNDAVVKVVGTSFNIKTNLSNTQVIVETGVVQVIRKQVVVRLKPREKADIDRRSGQIKKGVSTDRLYGYYRTQQIIADKTPLWRVAEVISDAYGVNVVIADKKLGRRTLTTVLNTNAPLDKNLKIIAETFNVTIKNDPGKIIIQ